MSHIDTDKMPGDALEQDVSVGGVVDGRMPTVAIPTVQAGISTTREVPPLRHTAMSIPLTQTDRPYRIGREVRRRRLILAASPHAVSTAYLVIATTEEQATADQGLQLTQGTNVTITGADMLWITCVGADLTLSFLAELDQG
jgi:hypothetical protein